MYNASAMADASMSIVFEQLVQLQSDRNKKCFLGKFNRCISRLSY